MKVAVFGCLHGQLNDMFEAVKRHEAESNTEIDLIIVCGDCQTIRHSDDLRCLAVPQKYKRLGDFHEYYSGKKQVPRLTIFVGGNHEASNYLMTLPYGGWICDNFYYMGFAGVINFRGLRIGGVSGIYNYHNCNKGRHERMPLDDNTIRSIYHTRRLDVLRLQLLSKSRADTNSLDVFMSHDWPARIYEWGNVEQLLRYKPFFREDMNKRDGLGSPLTQPLVKQLKPRRWFAAHLHCRFQASVKHDTPGAQCTDFLSLNKIEGHRQFVEFMDLEPIEATKLGENVLKADQDESNTGTPDAGANELYYDPEWLTVLRKTIDLEMNSRNNVACPSIDDESALTYFPTEDDVQETIKMMQETGGLQIKRNFCMTEPVIYNRTDGQPDSIDRYRDRYFPNPQHVELCSRLSIRDTMAVESKDINEQRGEQHEKATHDRHSAHHRLSTNPAYPHRNYHQDRPQHKDRPAKKLAMELDEDGCLPFSIDKSGDVQ